MEELNQPQPPIGQTLLKVEHESGAYHSYTEQEIQSYSEHINWQFGEDEDLKGLLPINLQRPASLFEALCNGILLCKMINQAKPDTIEMRAVNMKMPLSVYKIDENLLLVKGAA